MRIVVASSHFPPAWDWGGPARSMWNLVRALATLGVDVTVLTTNAMQRGTVDVAQYRLEEGVHIITSPVLGRGQFPPANRHGVSARLCLELAKTIRSADVLHINELWGATPAAAAVASLLGRRPYVVSARGQLENRSLAEKSWKKRVALELGIKRLVRSASTIHYTTETERDASPAWTKNLDSVVIPNPVEVAARADGAPFRARLGLTETDVLFGVFGRIHPRKGFDVLVPVLAELVDDASWTLVVIGPDEGGHRAEVERAVERAGLARRVVFIGALSGPELASAYAGTDILLLPSHGESFGNVVVEAAAQGTPCIVSDQVGLSGWVQANHAGLVSPLGAALWADALSNLTRAEIRERWQAARLHRLARDSFSPEAVATHMVREYKRLIARYTASGTTRFRATKRKKVEHLC